MELNSLRYASSYVSKSKNELLFILEEKLLYIELIENRAAANDGTMTAMSKDYQKLKKKFDELTKKHKELLVLYEKATDALALLRKDRFGCKSESINELGNGETAEPIDEDTVEDKEYQPKEIVNCSKPYNDYSDKTGRQKKVAGKLDEQLSKLPRKDKYIIDAEWLDQCHRNGWRIAFWKKSRKLKRVSAPYYVEYTHIPVIADETGELYTCSGDYECLLEKSRASASLVSEVLYNKFFLGVPLYRQEKSYKNYNVPLSRQTMDNWTRRFSETLFGPVYDYLEKQLCTYKYHQVDETPFRVLRDGRKAGSKSYMWVHITSELLKAPPITLFSFELTRGTDHLRKFYKDFEGFITCDAYCSYHVLGKENKDIITICGCMMHLRRRFANALTLIDTSKVDKDHLIEYQALIKISSIYKADEALKTVSADERYRRRKQEVKPLVEDFFEFIEKVDINTPLVGARLKDAISYAINQKEYLCRFLQNGNIPLDDGATERSIKNFAIGRNNFLFCNTVDGAKATAIMYTIVETARANNANVYWYLHYLLEEMPRYLDYKDQTFLQKMVPWSDEYKKYENEKMFSFDEENETTVYSEKPKKSSLLKRFTTNLDTIGAAA